MQRLVQTGFVFYAALQLATLYTVRISGAEIVAALFLNIRTGALGTADAQGAAMQFRADFDGEFQVIEVTERLVQRAMTLAETRALCGYDAVQLAAALEVQSERSVLQLSALTFICADDRLSAAAATEGLLVENPNLH